MSSAETTMDPFAPLSQCRRCMSARAGRLQIWLNFGRVSASVSQAVGQPAPQFCFSAGRSLAVVSPIPTSAATGERSTLAPTSIWRKTSDDTNKVATQRNA